jgi:hypothetical protein
VQKTKCRKKEENGSRRVIVSQVGRMGFGELVALRSGGGELLVVMRQADKSGALLLATRQWKTETHRE